MTGSVGLNLITTRVHPRHAPQLCYNNYLPSSNILIYKHSKTINILFFKAGKVVLTSNVLRHHESAAYDLSITISDVYNTVGPRTLTVTINSKS